MLHFGSKSLILKMTVMSLLFLFGGIIMSPKISDTEKEKRRMQIIQSAAEVFKRKGYVTSTMQDIVDETGMSRGWVYIYFSSKEEIIKALIEENEKETEIQINLLLTSTLSVWEGLCLLIDMTEEQITNSTDDMVIVLYEYFISGWKEADRRLFLEQHYHQQYQYLLKFLQKGIASGEFAPKVELDVITKMLTSFFEGIMLHAKALGAERVRVKEQLQLFKAFLKEVLQVKEGGS
jgi:AcrR family transcriptional regulator